MMGRRTDDDVLTLIAQNWRNQVRPANDQIAPAFLPERKVIQDNRPSVKIAATSRSGLLMEHASRAEFLCRYRKVSAIPLRLVLCCLRSTPQSPAKPRSLGAGFCCVTDSFRSQCGRVWPQSSFPLAVPAPKRGLAPTRLPFCTVHHTLRCSETRTGTLHGQSLPASSPSREVGGRSRPSMRAAEEVVGGAKNRHASSSEVILVADMNLRVKRRRRVLPSGPAVRVRLQVWSRCVHGSVMTGFFSP